MQDNDPDLEANANFDEVSEELMEFLIDDEADGLPDFLRSELDDDGMIISPMIDSYVSPLGHQDDVLPDELGSPSIPHHQQQEVREAIRFVIHDHIFTTARRFFYILVSGGISCIGYRMGNELVQQQKFPENSPYLYALGFGVSGFFVLWTFISIMRRAARGVIMDTYEDSPEELISTIESYLATGGEAVRNSFEDISHTLPVHIDLRELPDPPKTHIKE